MAVQASALDRRIQFERRGEEENGLGEPVGGWRPLGARWASVRFGTGAERREAAQERASVPATFRVRRCRMTAGLTAQDRLRFDELGCGGSAGLEAAPVWDITSVVPFEADAIDVTAVRSA